MPSHAALTIQRHKRKKGFCRHSKPECVEELRWACGSAITHQELTQMLFMLQFPHLGGNYCVKDLGSANEKYNTRSMCGWVGPYLFQPYLLLWCIILIHAPGKSILQHCRWEVSLLHWLHIEIFLLNAASALKEDKLTSSLPGCSGWIINQALEWQTKIVCWVPFAVYMDTLPCEGGMVSFSHGTKAPQTPSAPHCALTRAEVCI